MRSALLASLVETLRPPNIGGEIFSGLHFAITTWKGFRNYKVRLLEHASEASTILDRATLSTQEKSGKFLARFV